MYSHLFFMWLLSYITHLDKISHSEHWRLQQSLVLISKFWHTEKDTSILNSEWIHFCICGPWEYKSSFILYGPFSSLWCSNIARIRLFLFYACMHYLPLYSQSFVFIGIQSLHFTSRSVDSGKWQLVDWSPIQNLKSIIKESTISYLWQLHLRYCLQYG